MIINNIKTSCMYNYYYTYNMHVIKIDASKGQLSKLRNGHPVRVKKGTGFNVIVNPGTYNLVNRAFSKNKGVQISLSPEEIQVNREPEQVMEQIQQPEDETNLFDELPFSGQGIFGHQFDKNFERVAGRKGKKKAYKFARDVLNPLAKTGIMAGMATGATALSALQPEFAPVIIPVAAGVTDFMTDYLDKPSDFYDKSKSGIKGKRAKSLAQQFGKAKASEMMNERFGTNYDYMNRAGLEQAMSDKLNASLIDQSVSSRYAAPPSQVALNARRIGGQGIMRKTHSLQMTGRGASISSSSQPALESQALNANYHMKFFLPPQYQINGNGLGTGLYAGKGLYY
jgi:hypothetical protein